MPKEPLRKIFNNTVLGLLAILVIALGLAFASRSDELLHLYFCDVGQGDAILIKTPQNRQILVDGGQGDQVLKCLSEALPFYDRTLDLIVLTHPHADHVGGLTDVLRSYQVEKVVFWQVPYDSADFREFVDLVGEKGLPVLEMVAGEVLALDQQTRAEIWYPLSENELELLGTSIDPYDGEDVNDSSIIFRLVCGDFEALLTGDAPETVQGLLLRQEKVLESDVLKIAHHGSKDGLDERFLEKLRSRLAVISVGENNRYGHPHKETLEELENAGVEIKRTDQDGTIEVVSDCKTWWVR